MGPYPFKGSKNEDVNQYVVFWIVYSIYGKINWGMELSNLNAIYMQILSIGGGFKQTSLMKFMSLHQF